MESDIKRYGPSEQGYVEKKWERRAALEEPGRTPGRCEGFEIDADPSRQRRGLIEEPGRTPGRAEG